MRYEDEKYFVERNNIKTVLKKVTQWLKPNKQYVIKERKDSLIIKVDKGDNVAKDLFSKQQLVFLEEMITRIHNTKPKWFDEWHKEEFQPLKQNVDRIMQCPTIKKELAELQSE